MSLAHLAPEDAFALAISTSGQEVSTVAKALGCHESLLRRVLTSEKYFLSFEDLPSFCQVVNNTIIIDWQYARASQPTFAPAPIVDTDYLKSQVIDFTDELGAIAGKVKAAVADGMLSKPELRSILREVLDLEAQALTLAGALREAEKKVGRYV